MPRNHLGGDARCDLCRTVQIHLNLTGRRDLHGQAAPHRGRNLNAQRHPPLRIQGQWIGLMRLTAFVLFTAIRGNSQGKTGPK
ncbi:hypothetical protein TspCOW1_13910 [Thiohalobacter sp. COW1]|nr:hypothetical protein TspCOW1_13910 [Thiohalobacter sp. COW1]